MRENKTDRQTEKGRGREEGGRERREERDRKRGREGERGGGGFYVLDTDKLTIVIACTTLQLMSVDL